MVALWRLITVVNAVVSLVAAAVSKTGFSPECQNIERRLARLQLTSAMGNEYCQAGCTFIAGMPCEGTRYIDPLVRRPSVESMHKGENDHTLHNTHHGPDSMIMREVSVDNGMFKVTSGIKRSFDDHSVWNHTNQMAAILCNVVVIGIIILGLLQEQVLRPDVLSKVYSSRYGDMLHAAIVLTLIAVLASASPLLIPMIVASYLSGLRLIRLRMQVGVAIYPDIHFLTVLATSFLGHLYYMYSRDGFAVLSILVIYTIGILKAIEFANAARAFPVSYNVLAIVVCTGLTHVIVIFELYSARDTFHFSILSTAVMSVYSSIFYDAPSSTVGVNSDQASHSYFIVSMLMSSEIAKYGVDKKLSMLVTYLAMVFLSVYVRVVVGVALNGTITYAPSWRQFVNGTRTYITYGIPGFHTLRVLALGPFYGFDLEDDVNIVGGLMCLTLACGEAAFDWRFLFIRFIITSLFSSVVAYRKHKQTRDDLMAATFDLSDITTNQTLSSMEVPSAENLTGLRKTTKKVFQWHRTEVEGGRVRTPQQLQKTGRVVMIRKEPSVVSVFTTDQEIAAGYSRLSFNADGQYGGGAPRLAVGIRETYKEIGPERSKIYKFDLEYRSEFKAMSYETMYQSEMHNVQFLAHVPHHGRIRTYHSFRFDMDAGVIDGPFITVDKDDCTPFFGILNGGRVKLLGILKTRHGREAKEHIVTMTYKGRASSAKRIKPNASHLFLQDAADSTHRSSFYQLTEIVNANHRDVKEVYEDAANWQRVGMRSFATEAGIRQGLSDNITALKARKFDRECRFANIAVSMGAGASNNALVAELQRCLGLDIPAPGGGAVMQNNLSLSQTPALPYSSVVVSSRQRQPAQQLRSINDEDVLSNNSSPSLASSYSSASTVKGRDIQFVRAESPENSFITATSSDDRPPRGDVQLVLPTLLEAFEPTSVVDDGQGDGNVQIAEDASTAQVGTFTTPRQPAREPSNTTQTVRWNEDDFYSPRDVDVPHSYPPRSVAMTPSSSGGTVRDANKTPSPPSTPIQRSPTVDSRRTQTTPSSSSRNKIGKAIKNKFSSVGRNRSSSTATTSS